MKIRKKVGKIKKLAILFCGKKVIFKLVELWKRKTKEIKYFKKEELKRRKFQDRFNPRFLVRK